MDSLCANAMQRALLALERNDSESWCAPLVEALESLCEGSSTEWCVDVICRVLAPCATDEDAETLVDLQRLVDSHPSAAELRRKTRDIWYARKERTALQTATSKLYEAVAAYESGDRRRYKRGIAVTVSEIVVAGITTAGDERVRHALEAFKRLCEQLQCPKGNRDDRQQ
jgi:hypothetical protein